MAAPSDSPRQPAREFLARFGDRSFADALDLVTDDGRVQLVEAFPDEFQEDDLDAHAVLEEYWWGLYGQYGEFEGVEAVVVEEGGGESGRDERVGEGPVPEGEITADLAFAGGCEAATLQLAEDGVAGLSFAPEYEVPDYVDRDAIAEREITVDAGSVALDGILTLPEGEGPFPGVLLVHGAGLHDPDATAGATKIHRDLAWGLASAGIASLRYEKRLNDHEVADENYTLDTVVTDDAVAAVTTLGEAEDVDADRVFVAGHSQGGMCAPRIAERHGDVAGIVLLDAPAEAVVDPDDVQIYIRYSMERDGDLSEAQRGELEAQLKTFERIAAGDLDPDETVMGKPGTWHLSHHEYEPVATASELDVPAFVAGTGRADAELQPDLYDAFRERFEQWQSVALPAGSRIEFYDAVDHYFQEGPTPVGMSALYFGGNVAPYVIEDVAAWIHEVAAD
jgi:pimeloyl-ACP methyl ester carboxylesterase